MRLKNDFKRIAEFIKLRLDGPATPLFCVSLCVFTSALVLGFSLLAIGVSTDWKYDNHKYDDYKAASYSTAVAITPRIVYPTEQVELKPDAAANNNLSKASNHTDPAEEITVYVTKTGSKYHRSGCSYLKSKREIPLEDAVDMGYEPCSRCKP